MLVIQIHDKVVRAATYADLMKNDDVVQAYLDDVIKHNSPSTTPTQERLRDWLHERCTFEAQHTAK